MSYIKYEIVPSRKLTCTHPKVKRIWEWSSFPASPEETGTSRYISLELENEIRRFEDTVDGTAESKIEKFLSKI